MSRWNVAACLSVLLFASYPASAQEALSAGQRDLGFAVGEMGKVDSSCPNLQRDSEAAEAMALEVKLDLANPSDTFRIGRQQGEERGRLAADEGAEAYCKGVLGKYGPGGTVARGLLKQKG